MTKYYVYLYGNGLLTTDSPHFSATSVFSTYNKRLAELVSEDIKLSRIKELEIQLENAKKNLTLS